MFLKNQSLPFFRKMCIFAAVTNPCSMSKYQIPYTNACIRAFGRRFQLPTKEAFMYLLRFRGIAFLVDFYEIEHLQSIEDAVDDLIVCCQNNGGYLA